MKKIYFACSIRGGRDDADAYAELAQFIKTKAILMTEIFVDKKLSAMGMDKPSYEIWKTDTEWVAESAAVIAEVTNPSLGVGYEIAKAEEWGKPVLALFRKGTDKKLSAMIEGSPHVKTIYYDNLSEATNAIESFIASVE